MSVISGRIDFSKLMVNTLEMGATNLVIADLNEQSANIQALSTRQQFANGAFNLGIQAEQAILSLFR